MHGDHAACATTGARDQGRARPHSDVRLGFADRDLERSDRIELRASRRLLQALRAAPGHSWYGPVSCCAPGALPTRFFSLIHTLCDCAVALIYCHDSRTGPVEIVAVIPPELRARLRPDFPFEFMAFSRFLGALSEGGALTVHDLIVAAIEGSPSSEALVFSISTGLWTSDLDHVLSFCVERIALSMLEWVAER